MRWAAIFEPKRRGPVREGLRDLASASAPAEFVGSPDASQRGIKAERDTAWGSVDVPGLDSRALARVPDVVVHAPQTLRSDAFLLADPLGDILGS